MSNIHYRPHQFQKKFHLSKARIRLAAAAKRSGKTEAGAIESVIHAETQPGYVNNGIDPYLGVIIAPTADMLRRLSLQKLLAYGSHMVSSHHQTHGELTWHNGSKVLAISADKPQRLEGIKASWVWL